MKIKSLQPTNKPSIKGPKQISTNPNINNGSPISIMNECNAPEYHGNRCDVGMVERVAVSAWEKGRAAMGEGALEGKGGHGGAISGDEGVGGDERTWRREWLVMWPWME